MTGDEIAIPRAWRDLLALPLEPPLRFCLGLGHYPWAVAQAQGQDPSAAVARTLVLARAADVAGLDSVWLTEDPEGWDAFAVLGAMAQITRRVRLGTGVTNPYLRHPNLLAASAATLDLLSGGRAFLGLGRGQTEWYGRALGIEAVRPVALLEETFALLRGWWQPPHRASAAGPIPIHNWERNVGPVQPHLPIYLAAVGPRALSVAARHADGVIFNALASDEFLAETIPQIRADATAAGRDPARLAFILRTVATVTDNPAAVYERDKTSIAMINALPGMDRLLRTSDFDIPAIMAEVRRRMHTDEILAEGGGFPALRETGDLAAARAAIPTALVARLTIAGPLAQVRTRLEALTRLGVTHVFVAS